MPRKKQVGERVPVPFPDEPGAVYMTPEEWSSFCLKLGEACAFYWCEQADRYAEEYPARWRRYKNHARTLLNWAQMRVADGYEFFEHPTYGAGYYKSWVIDRLQREGR